MAGNFVHGDNPLEIRVQKKLYSTLPKLFPNHKQSFKAIQRKTWLSKSNRVIKYSQIVNYSATENLICIFN